MVVQASPEVQVATTRLLQLLATSVPGSDDRILACGGIQLLIQLLCHGSPAVQGAATAALGALCSPSLATSKTSCQLVLASDALHFLGPLLDVSDLSTRTSMVALLCPLSWQGPDASRIIAAVIGTYRSEPELLAEIASLAQPCLDCMQLRQGHLDPQHVPPDLFAVRMPWNSACLQPTLSILGGTSKVMDDLLANLANLCGAAGWWACLRFRRQSCSAGRFLCWGMWPWLTAPALQAAAPCRLPFQPWCPCLSPGTRYSPPGHRGSFRWLA